MNALMSIDDLNHEEIRAWLERALRGQKPLPQITRDEFPHVGILRLEKTLKPATRDSLRDGALQLVRQFCADGQGESAYLVELFALTSAFRNPEAVHMLAQLARRFYELPQISSEVRLAVLATLVDTPPPQSVEFWDGILQQDPEKYVSLTLSGVLAINPARAIELLPAMPNTERVGQAAALKLDLAWDDLPPKQRSRFVQGIQAILLAQCGSRFAGPVQAWVDSKEEPHPANANPDLWAALVKYHGLEDVKPRSRDSRLRQAA